jgi:WD40 repeat protein
LVQQLQEEEPPRPRSLDPRVPRDLETIVLKATAKAPEHRYQSADEMAEDLRRFVEREPIQARRTGALERGRMWCRRHPALAGLYLVLLLAAVCSTYFAFHLQGLLQESEAVRKQKEEAEQSLAERKAAQAEQLYRSLLAQARASRLSRRMGQRYDSLKALAEAARIARELNKPPESFLELRNEAIACLALRDLRVAREWDGWSEVASDISFDSALEHYAREDRGDRISICSVARDGAATRTLSGKGMVLSPNGRFLGFQGLGAGWEVWDLENPASVPLWRTAMPARCCTFSADSRQLAVCSGRGVIDVYELPSGKQLRHLATSPPFNFIPNVLALHPRQPTIAEADARGVVVRDLETGKVLRQFAYHSNPWPAAAWHPDGKVLAAVGGDGTVRFWDVSAGREISKLEGFRSGGNSLAFDPTGELVATTGWEGRLRLWDWRLGQQLLNIPADSMHLQFSAAGDRLACAFGGKKLTIWQVSPGREYRTLVPDLALGKESCPQTAVSRDGRLLAAAMREGFSLWDLQRGRMLQFVAQNWTTTVRFEPSGSLLTFGLDGLIRWPVKVDPGAPDPVRVGPPQVLTRRGAAASAGQSRDGNVTAFGLLGGGAGILHKDQARPILLSHGDVWGADVSPDGRWVATGCQHSTGVRVWEAKSGKLVRELLTQHTGCGVAFSHDGKWLATSGGGLRLWAVGSWQEGRHFGGGTFAFSHDGRLIAIETGQGAVRLVNPATGREFARLEDPHQHRATHMTFSRDGSSLVTATGDSRSIHVWDLWSIRQQLAAMDLDWDAPFPAPSSPREPLWAKGEAHGLATEKPNNVAEASRTVSWAAPKPQNVFADPAHALTEVIDFRDLAGATVEEFHAWRAALGADFRLALLTSRADIDRSLLSAVAVREKKPRLAQFHPGMTWDEGERTWRRLRKQKLRALLTCDYTTQGQLVTSQLWVSSEGSWTQWGDSLPGISGHIADNRRSGMRPTFLHGPAPGGDGNYFRANCGADAGRKWRLAICRSPEQLVAEVERRRRDGWRPDVLAPFLDDGQLCFLLIAVDNNDRVDWRFRMDMSLEQYRAETFEQKRQGLFPLALVSYRGDADARYAAVWVRYRLVGDGVAKK